ncbi:MAG: hypothetical protein FWE95_11210 [Planctomycetaceae bacterium]|nr:hypothetical protein [Planctomycetaceae bacterium]
MLTWLLLIPVAALFVATNIIIGCYVAIRLGYGPPDWKTALNLVVRVTTLQDRLNASRDWLDKKAPWADKLLVRLGVPKPIIIVDAPEPEEEEEIANEISTNEISEVPEEAVGEAMIIPSDEGFSDISVDGLLTPRVSQGTEAEQNPHEPK